MSDRGQGGARGGGAGGTVVVLGETGGQAKLELLAADPEASAVVDGWSLLGDPALTLPPGPL